MVIADFLFWSRVYMTLSTDQIFKNMILDDDFQEKYYDYCYQLCKILELDNVDERIKTIEKHIVFDFRKYMSIDDVNFIAVFPPKKKMLDVQFSPKIKSYYNSMKSEYTEEEIKYYKERLSRLYSFDNYVMKRQALEREQELREIMINKIKDKNNNVIKENKFKRI